MTRAQLGGLTLLALVGAGCNTRDVHDTDAAVRGAGLDGFIEQLASSMCGWQFRCCTLPEIDFTGQSTYLTEPSCRTAISRQLGLSLAEVRLAIDNGRMALDPQASDTCAARFDKMECNSLARNPNTPPTSVWERFGLCLSPFVGKVALKGACSLPGECRPGTSCGSSAGRITESGLRALPLLTDEVPIIPAHCQLDSKEGESCLFGAECAAGLYCRRTDLVCARPAAEDQACNQPRDSMGAVLATFVACAESPRPLICVGERCRHLPRQDEPCLPQSGSTPLCEVLEGEPLTCVGQGFNGTGICKQLGKKGDYCSTGDGVAPCDVPWVCQDNNTSVGTCQAAPVAGSPCSLDGRCAPPAVCYLATETCIVPPAVPDGTPCNSDIECASLNCAPSSAQASGLGVCVPQGSSACVGRGVTAVSGLTPPTDTPVNEDAGVILRTDARTAVDTRTAM